jgi:hypothetical protein
MGHFSVLFVGWMSTLGELAGQREAVLARLNDYALTVSDQNQLKLLQDLEAAVIRSYRAVTGPPPLQ